MVIHGLFFYNADDTVDCTAYYIKITGEMMNLKGYGRN
jgi:hypothetical protein